MVRDGHIFYRIFFDTFLFPFVLFFLFWCVLFVFLLFLIFCGWLSQWVSIRCFVNLVWLFW